MIDHFRRQFILLPAIGLLLAFSGCVADTADIQMDSPDMTAYVQLIMPTRIEIQRHWTKPVSFADDGNADGIEMILAAYDSFGDLTKVVGTLHFELHTRRMASADRLDKRVAFWSVELNSRRTLTEHWDPLARFYRFPLQLTATPLPPGRYILTARLVSPDDKRLVDQYEFTHQAGTAPPASAGP